MRTFVTARVLVQVVAFLAAVVVLGEGLSPHRSALWLWLGVGVFAAVVRWLRVSRPVPSAPVWRTFSSVRTVPAAVALGDPPTSVTSASGTVYPVVQAAGGPLYDVMLDPAAPVHRPSGPTLVRADTNWHLGSAS